MFRLKNGAAAIDTPGFSSFDAEDVELEMKTRLPELFRDFAPYASDCRFADCAHVCEAGCAVIEAVNEGKICRSRHESYIRLHEQLKELKELWQDERFEKGRELLISRILKLIKELKPRRGKGYLRLGFDDPYTTGQAMMLASVLYPLYAEHIEMIPDFDKEIIDGELDIRGRIRVIVPAEAALRIFFNKQLRAMYKKARRILELDT